jgi:hypothetical protein
VGIASLPIAIIFSVLPASWRMRLGIQEGSIAPGTLICGLLELLLGVIFGVVSFIGYRAQYIAQLSEPNTAGRMIFSVTMFIGFMFFSAKGWLAIYVTFEGILRAAAGAAGQGCGIGPLWLVEKARASTIEAKKRREAREGEDVRDEAREEEGCFEIWSARKKSWDRLTTIEIRGQLYHLTSYNEREEGLRRHVYELRPIPPGWVMRRTETYEVTS